MTADYVAFHAAERPKAVAAVVQGRAVTYPELRDDVHRFAAALRGLGLARGARVAVQCADPYCHWLILLAAEALGLVTLSLADGEDPESAALQVGFDFVLWQQIPPHALRAHHASADWLTRVRAAPVIEATALWPVGPEDPLRISRTSGTTGEQKNLLATRRILESQIYRWTAFYAVVPGSRCLFHLPFGVASSYTLSLAVARAGATLVFETRVPALQAIAANAITHMLVMPFSLERMIEAVPDSFTKPACLRLISLGGKIPPVLRQKVMARLAIELSDNFGCNEVGTIAARNSNDPTAYFTVRPGMQVEIVDDRDQPLLHGQMGKIRVRSPHMFSEYLNDPQASARMFKGGWFYPGDQCVLHAPRHIEVIGRNDEMLNIGGAKFMPGEVEAALRALAGGDDVAISTLPNADGVEEICIAVTGERIEQRVRDFAPVLRGLPGRIHLLPLPAIPRTESGKVRRDRLREALLRLRETENAPD